MQVKSVSYKAAMTIDDTIIPEHNMVSSEWEKKEVIRSAHDIARARIIPRLIDILEERVGDSVWVASTDILCSPSALELWDKPDYVTVHDAPSSKNNVGDSGSNSISVQGTSTKLYLIRQEKQIDNIAISGKGKIPKGFPDKCLLRHEFSKGSDYIMVCKLRRRHQKEIAKHPSFLSPSSSSNPALSLSILDGLARSAVLKHYNQLSNKHQPPQLEKQEPILQEEWNKIIVDALSIVRAAENLEVGEVPKTTVVRWKAEDEFQVRYFS